MTPNIASAFLNLLKKTAKKYQIIPDSEIIINQLNYAITSEEIKINQQTKNEIETILKHTKENPNILDNLNTGHDIIDLLE